MAAAHQTVTPAGEFGDQHEIVTQLDSAIPDAIVVSSEAEADAASALEGLVSVLADTPGVEWLLVDTTLAPNQLLIGFDPQKDDQPLAAVEAAVHDHIESTELDPGLLTITGRAIVDRELNDMVNRGVILATIVLVIAAGALVGVVFDWRQGLAVAGVVLGSVYLATITAAQSTGGFDGSLVTTAVPGMLAASVVSVVVAGRVLLWFLHPQGEDQAEMIRKSVRDIGSELVIMLAGAVVLAVFLEWIDTGRSVATVSLIGAFVAGTLVAAVLPPVLASLVSAEGASVTSGSATVLTGKLLPNGRDFPLIALAGFGLIMLLLAAGSLGQTASDRLLDWGSLDQGDASAVADVQASGDATGAILARFPEGTAQVAKTAWMENVSQLDHVARVDSTGHRHIDGQTEELSGAAGQLGAVADHEEAPLYALVVPEVPARSLEAIRLVENVETLNVLVGAELSGVSPDATRAAQRDRSVIWITLIAVSLTGAVLTLIVTGDTGLAGMSGGVRALGSAAIVGLYAVAGGTPGGAEVLIVMFAVSIGATFFELALLWRLASNNEGEDDDRPIDEQVSQALHSEVAPAACALVLVGLVGLALATSGLGILSRLGLVLFLASAIEVVVTSWMIRPAVLGGRRILNPLTRSIRHHQHDELQSATVHIDPEPWVPIVEELLQAEFAFQSDPSGADLESLYLSGTSLFHQAVEHHRQLESGGFSIVGRKPRLVDLRVVSVAEQANLIATVDHPLRHLIGSDGGIVGVRNAERRSVMLWLTAMSDATYRMADSVEMDATAFESEPDPANASQPAESGYQPITGPATGHVGAQ